MRKRLGLPGGGNQGGGHTLGDGEKVWEGWGPGEGGDRNTGGGRTLGMEGMRAATGHGQPCAVGL